MGGWGHNSNPPHKEKSEISEFLFDCIEHWASEISSHVWFTMNLKQTLEKQKELTETKLAADNDSISIRGR
jgi:hypothetical protein